jgi:hypothetical protein
LHSLSIDGYDFVDFVRHEIENLGNKSDWTGYHDGGMAISWTWSFQRYSKAAGTTYIWQAPEILLGALPAESLFPGRHAFAVRISPVGF